MRIRFWDPESFWPWIQDPGWKNSDPYLTSNSCSLMEAVGMVLKSLKTVCLAGECLAAVRTGVGAFPRVRLQVPAQVLLVLQVGGCCRLSTKSIGVVSQQAAAVFRIRIWSTGSTTFWALVRGVDPDPSIILLLASKIVRKTLILTVFLLLLDFLSLKNDVKVIRRKTYFLN